MPDSRASRLSGTARADDDAAPANRRDERFWAAQRYLKRRGVSLIEVAAAAYALILEDQRRDSGTGHRSYDKALRDAVVAISAAAKAKHAANTKKARPLKNDDLLDTLIRDLVIARPDVTFAELNLYLRACQHGRGVIELTATAIIFLVPGPKGSTHRVEFPQAGLRARYSRIRKAVQAGLKRDAQSPERARPDPQA